MAAEEKNRFSILLEHLMTTGEIKNYTLARYLKYDVSYISKWISGRMLPAEKIQAQVLRSISECIAGEADPDSRAKLLQEYRVTETKDLEEAIFDNLEAEYLYVHSLKKTTGFSVAPKTFYYPAMTLQDYIRKMQHPVLRRVKSLEIIAQMDLLAMDREERMKVVGLKSDLHQEKGGSFYYPDVHFTLMAALDERKWDPVYDTLFIVNMMSSTNHLDFKLFSGSQAAGRAIFVVKDDYAITGFISDKSHCMSVTTTEEPEHCRAVYDQLLSACTRERQMFRKLMMADQLNNHGYVHYLLSPNARWIIGHLTEHFLPDDLFEELAAEHLERIESRVSLETFRSVHQVTRNVVRNSKLRILITEAAFAHFVMTGYIDFYGLKVRLTPEQRKRAISYTMGIFNDNRNLEIRLIYGQLVSEPQFTNDQCMFLSDMVSSLRINEDKEHGSLFEIGRQEAAEMFGGFFEEVWDHHEDVVIMDKAMISDYLDHMMQGIDLISQ